MSLPHDSSHLHVRGLSEYVDDRALQHREVFLELVYSPEAFAKLRKIDTRAAKAVPGVVGVFLASDFADNLWGTIFRDQPLLAANEVHYAGEIIAIVAAESREAARAARSLVKVEYELLAAIRSINDAKTHKSFIGSSRTIQRGDLAEGWKKSDHTLEGTVVIRGADHFYLESNVAIAYPREDGQIEVHSSSQHPTEVQHVVARALGIPQSSVTCIVKRMGGAFGGKESQAAPFAAYAALVAHKLQRPARLVLTKDDDMIITGKRNPFQNDYRVGFDKNGIIQVLEADLYSDGGAYADLSTSIMERAMLHIDNAYFIPNLRVTGQVCRTHFHPHTAFRGFGGPKGVATIERIVEEIAKVVGCDALDIRKRNCYGSRPGTEVTHYGQTVENNMLPQLFDQLERECDYRSRRAQIQEHNRQVLSNRNSQKLLRGLSLTPVKFGISFTTRFLNQANALVLCHRDGTLQVSTGATEMGQGVNARIAELVANELGIARDAVRMMPTTTDKNANTSPTAASSGTDLNGAAALVATRKLKSRLSHLAVQLFDLPEARWARVTAGLGTEAELRVDTTPYSEESPNQDVVGESGVAEYHGVRFDGGRVFSVQKPDRSVSFVDLVNEAFHNRISLSEYGFYRFSNLSFNKLTGTGQAFLYFTQGVAATEVSVNMDTGETKTLRTDILMDLGRPINEGLDIGQVTGGFIQGLGWMTTEKLYYSAKGLLVSHSPSTYKIPNIQDTPRVFNVKLIPNLANKPNVRGTKAVGEPPLLLAISAWTAIHDAICSATEGAVGSGHDPYPKMELPATQEQVLRQLRPQFFAKYERHEKYDKRDKREKKPL